MTETERKPTPMMERYLELKAQNPQAILFFRMGDFYELFYEDAVTAARTLGLTLTSRDKGSTNPVPMAGFPYHALDGYLRKMVRAGFRVAVCEQMEDPKQAKGLVKRDISRIVTPGTLTDDALLDPREHNFLACVVPLKERCGLAWLEISSGRFVMTDLETRFVGDELARIRPAECVIPESSRTSPMMEEIRLATGTVFSDRPDWSFSLDPCRQSLLDHFRVQNLSGFDVDESGVGVIAAGALFDYVRETQRCGLGHIDRLEPYRRGSCLIIDEATRRSLELTRTIRDGERDGSLLAVIDETVTSMGSRLLGEWLSNPLTDVAGIAHRLDAVEELSQQPLWCQEIREQLKAAYDLQRLTARVATGRASPRDLGCLTRTLGLLPKLKAMLTGRKAALIGELESRMELCADLRADIEAALIEEPPLLVTEGGLIRDGYHAQLDEWRDLAKGGKAWMARYQATEVERTGITTLKVGFNRVFGYYLECTSAWADKVPADYIRKQTLKNQERFITPQLKEYEEKVLRAEGQSIQLEQELFQQLRERVSSQAARLRQTAEVLAELDVLAGLAVLATSGRYCRPELTTEPILEIHEGRHPVLDRLRPSGEFVPNDVILGVNAVSDSLPDESAQSPAALPNAGRLQLITGPNMAGKSTYIRQAALLTILAQMGSFVPAKSARIGIADRVFARVGASDELGKGQSTFMVEMTETARILNAATQTSLVILDEIGRGTSTYDGISLAWAVTEYLHDVVGCRTLFATHYHELTQLTQSLKEAANWNVAVREVRDGIVFLHKIVPGAADKSYGIHVARLAGVPKEVLDRACVVLSTLENDHTDESGRTKMPARKTNRKREFQLQLFEAPEHPILGELRDLKLDELTPLKALQELHRIREKLG